MHPGFTGHLFALMNLFGYRFAPRIRNIGKTRLYTPANDPGLPAPAPLIGGTINTRTIAQHWDGLLRLAASLKNGTVTPSLMMPKLGAYPRQNGLGLALRELGRMERTLFPLDWLQDLGLRRKVTAVLNKGEARNTLARAVFFNRKGEIRDCSFEKQRYRSSSLNLLTAAIILGNTVYLDRTITTLTSNGADIDPDLLRSLSPRAGNTSTSLANTPGPAPTTSNPAEIGHFDAPQTLNVGYFTFSQAAPTWAGKTSTSPLRRKVRFLPPGARSVRPGRG